MDYKSFIEQWKINKSLLALKMGMADGTFRNKYSGNQTKFSFTMDEEQLLIKVLQDMFNALGAILKENKVNTGTHAALKMAGRKIVDLNKTPGEKPYNPMENQRFKSKNKIKL